MISMFTAVTGALGFSVLAGFMAARYLGSRAGSRSKRLGLSYELPVGGLAVLSAVTLLHFGPNLSTWPLLLVPVGVLLGGMAYRTSAVPRDRYSPEEVDRITLRWKVIVLPTAMALLLVILTALGNDFAQRPPPPPPDPDTSKVKGPAPGPPRTAADTVIMKEIESSRSLSLSLSGDFTPLARAIESLTGKSLPAALGIAGIATEAGRKFTSSLAERSGQNVSDLLFEWIKREKTYSANEQRTSRVPSDTARPAPALHVVRFDHGRSEPSASGVRLAGDIAHLHRSSGSLIFLVGYADRTGGANRNLRLAHERAWKVARVLALHGVPELHIFCLVRPETAAPVPTPDGVLEPENRRVEVWIR